MTEPIEPEVVEPAEPAVATPIELPADHPLVKTLAAQKADLKQLREKAKRLDDLEDAQRTEIERAQARAEAAERELNQTRLEALRAQVALDKKLTPSQAKRLVGATREELEADADELLADLKNTAPAAAASSEGQGKQGEVVGQTKQITSKDQLKSMTAQEIVAARRDGRLNELMGVKS